MSDRPLIAIAGFQHETNTFSNVPAGMAEFEMADSWPGLLRGQEVLTGTDGLNLPISGFASAAQGRARLAPILWAAAEPSGRVTSEAFDTICGEILAGLEAAQPDAIYLDLHGAMVAEGGIEDGETELLRRVRAVWPEVPIAVSLDLHANLGAGTGEMADVICIYRTYPHLDMAETGARCLPRLLEVIGGRRYHRELRPLPYLIPLHAQSTDNAPARELYQGLIDGPDGWTEFAAGFTAADSDVVRPAALACFTDPDAAEQEADDLAARILEAESAFEEPLLSASEAVARAMDGPAPVVIADAQDNPGGGGSSDTTGLLRALVEGGAQGALLGMMADPDAAGAAHRAGVGGRFTARIGGRGTPGDVPYEVAVEVMALSDGRVPYEGDMYGGGIAEIGPTALLRIDREGCGVEVVVSTGRSQCLDRAYFRHLGRPPEDARIVVVKSTAHFRADFAPMASAILCCAVPGSLSCDLASVPYRSLLKGLRVGPNGPAFRAKPTET